MRVKCKREDFLHRIQNIQGVISPRSTLPILSYFLLKAKDKKISLFSTDLEVGIKCTFSGDIIDEGGITLPARRVAELIREFPEGEIEIFSEENITTLKSMKAKVRIHTLPPDDFPDFPEIIGKKITMEGELLKSMLEKTIFAVSQEESKYALNGVYIFFEDGQIEMVATDGRRLVLKEETLENQKDKQKIDCILPTKACSEIIRIINEGEVTVTWGEKQINFSQRDVTLTSRLIEGEFPDYNAVIPKNFQEKVIINREELKDAVGRAYILTKEKGGSIKIDIKNNRMMISSKVPEVGESSEELAIKHDGGRIEIAFDPEYLLDMLKVIESEEVIMGLNSAKEAALIRPMNDEKFIYILMPIEM